MPSIALPSKRTEPRSGLDRPATTVKSVDFPQPMNPTIETNSPRSTDKVTSSRTCRVAAPVPNAFEIEERSMNATFLTPWGPTPRFPGSGASGASFLSTCPQLRFSHAHQPVEHEADHADRQDREQNVRVNE